MTDVVSYLSPTGIVCGWCTFSYADHVNGYAFLDDHIDPEDGSLVEVYCERDPLNILIADLNAPVTFTNGDQFPIAHGDFDYYAETVTTLKDTDLSNAYLTDANPFAFVEDEYDTSAKELDFSSRYVDYIEFATEYDPYAKNDWLWASQRYSDKAPVVHNKTKNSDGTFTYTIVSGEFTSATHAWRGTVDPFANAFERGAIYTYPTDSLQAIGSLPNAINVSEGQTRNAFWKGEEGVNAGHLVVNVYDPHLTALYQNRLLNIFNDKRTGILRCGGLELTKSDHFAYAKCVNSRCKASITVALDASIDVKEGFVLDIIRHGNNHAAAWFTTRDTFYKVHQEGCAFTLDTPCNNGAHCADVNTADVHLLNANAQLNEWADMLNSHFSRSA